MSPATDDATQTIPPDDAFARLGNEIRMEILQELGRATNPLSFSEVRERVGIGDSGQFNYHLGKLEGHFVRETDDGYELRQPGRRVIEAVLSGAVTETPALEPTQIDFGCRLCGAPVKVSYGEERVEMYCTNCAGLYDETIQGMEEGTDLGWLGGLSLPPAGVYGRTAMELFRAASTWFHLELMAWANDICPRCSGTVEQSVSICEDHAADDGICDACGHRHAAMITGRCANCIHEMRSLFPVHLLNTPELMSFLIERGYQPLSGGHDWGWDWEEDIRSVDPFKAEFSLTINEDTLSLTVDDDLDVVQVEIG